MSKHSDLDPATSEFLTQVESGLDSVPNVSRELGSGKFLKTRGGNSAIYVAHWTPTPGAEPIEVSLTLCLQCMNEKPHQF